MNHSRQRDLILEYLKSTKSHPTAEDVYTAVREKEPEISLGTVYRNLKQLSNNKIIVRLNMENGIDHFDADTSAHCHFYCTECNRVLDLDMTMPASVQRFVDIADSISDGKVEGCTMYFHGKCRECLKKNEEAE